MTGIVRASPRFAALMSMLMLVSFGLAGWSFYNAHRNACASRNVSLNVLADVLSLAKPSEAQISRLPADQQDRTRRFFASAFKRINTARC